MKLYELNASFNKIFDLLNSEDELDFETLEDTLQAVEGAMEVKVGNIAKMIKWLEGYVTVYDSEAKRLAAKKKSTENKIKWLKDYLLQTMEVTKKDKFQTDIGVVRRQKNPATVNVLDAALIPLKYWVIAPPPPPAVDKKAILDAIKSGSDVLGVENSQGYHIRIQ